MIYSTMSITVPYAIHSEVKESLKKLIKYGKDKYPDAEEQLLTPHYLSSVGDERGITFIQVAKYESLAAWEKRFKEIGADTEHSALANELWGQYDEQSWKVVPSILNIEEV